MCSPGDWSKRSTKLRINPRTRSRKPMANNIIAKSLSAETPFPVRPPSLDTYITRAQAINKRVEADQPSHNLYKFTGTLASGAKQLRGWWSIRKARRFGGALCE